MLPHSELAKLFQGIAAPTLSPRDTPDEIHRKQVVIPVCVVAVSIVLLVWVHDLVAYSSTRFRCAWWGYTLGWVPLAALVARAYLQRSLPMRWVVSATAAANLGVILSDWGNATAVGGMRTWPLTVAIMDIYLAVGAPRAAQQLVLSATAAWVVISSVHEVYSLGLYGLEGWTDYDMEDREKRCRCAEPPCPTGRVPEIFTRFFTILLVLYTDYWATRHFAEGQRKEQAKVAVMVETAERVAGLLAQFDLAAAEDALKGAISAGRPLPPRLACSYRTLLRNLASYRPYLPDSCFYENDEECDSWEGSHLGASRRPTDPEAAPREGPVESAALGAVLEVACKTPSPPLGQSRAPSAAMSPCREFTTATSFSGMRRQVTATTVMRRLSSAASLGEERQNSGESALPSTSSGESVPGRVPTAPGHAPRARRVTLLFRNSCGLLAAAARTDAANLSAWLAAEVERFCSAVRLQGGMTLLISADHLSASFGALKTQGTHCSAAVCVAWVLAAARPAAPRVSPEPATREGEASSPPHRSGSVPVLSTALSSPRLRRAAGSTGVVGSPHAKVVASPRLKPAGSPRLRAEAPCPPIGVLHSTAAVGCGRALCGDFGSAAAQRFMVIGGVGAFVVAAERAAAAWGVGVLVDAAVHSDVEPFWSCRLRKRVCFPKLSSKRIALWQVVEDRMGDQSGDEWMYELESARPNPWRGYNAAVETWCTQGAEQALGVVTRALEGLGTGGSTAAREGLLAVRELAQEGAAPPVGDLSAAAFAGDPAPLHVRGSRRGSLQVTPV
eukprot:TRINITY_DN149_c1_g1_i2.p1 TRINITY_DN149_c1_g1~~TRINITY_DN149_c1_g1_i2.p1  ORF type:complete len:787 (+),score=172.53 TRINITY_DN149_c1_g1_i2:99-2459(+)